MNPLYHSQLTSNTSLLFCKGWAFRSYETTKKFRSYYQYIFDPKIDKKYYAEEYLRKPSNNVLIGIHIRRGDYANHLNGKYLFSDHTFINKVHELTKQLNTHCQIILFSNDQNLNVQLYKAELKNVTFSQNNLFVDHYLMSQCDYLIGPPSTFTMWASYIGNTRYYHLENESDQIQLENFKICDG
jgi:hypothetical protein